MRSFAVHFGRGLGGLLGVLLATLAHGQQINVIRSALGKTPPAQREAEKSPPRGSIHRIELYSGLTRSVRYVTSGDVPNNEREAADELQRAENELLYIQDLERLKQQYVASERQMEPQRRAVQNELYGTSISTGRDFSGYGSARLSGGWGGYGMYGGLGALGMYGGLVSYAGGYGLPGGYGFLGGYGNRWSNYANGYTGESWRTQTRSLQNGVGDEGRFKDAMVQVIAKQAAPEYANEALHRYEHALTRAAASPMLAKALSTPRPAAPRAEYEPSYPRDSKVSIWVGSDKYTGIVKEDRPGWVVLETEEGEVRVRKSGIMRSQVFAEQARHQSGEKVSKRP